MKYLNMQLQSMADLKTNFVTIDNSCNINRIFIYQNASLSDTTVKVYVIFEHPSYDNVSFAFQAIYTKAEPKPAEN